MHFVGVGDCEVERFQISQTPQLIVLLECNCQLISDLLTSIVVGKLHDRPLCRLEMKRDLCIHL